MVKNGFSLAEALIVMAVISILFGAVSKIITTRPKPPVQENSHGYFECYYNGGLKQHYVRNGADGGVTSVAQCTFEPPSNIAFYNINTYGPVYYTGSEPNVDNKIYISVGSGSIVLQSDSGTRELTQSSLTDTEASTESNTRLYLKSVYPNSNMYTACGGTICSGLFISW